MRRVATYAGYGLGALLGLALLVAAGLAVRLAIAPISLAFLASDVREAIGETLYWAYDVKFSDLRLSWSDGHGNLGLAMVDVRVADYSLDDIAAVPEILVGVSPGAAITGGQAVRAVTVREPHVRWIRTVGGAIKFDIGADTPGESGKILEDFLIMMAAAPDPSETEDEAVLPVVRIVDADIRIGDEAAGSTTHISDADIVMEPDAAGVRSAFALMLETEAAPARISAEGLYKTADQRIELVVRTADLSLAELGLGGRSPFLEILPSEPMTGSIRFEMDKFFTVSAAAYALEGPTTAVEGSAIADAALFTLEAEYTLAGRPAAAAWPPPIGAQFAQWMEANETSGALHLTLRGTIDRLGETLDLRGSIGPPETPITISGPAVAPDVSLGAPANG